MGQTTTSRHMTKDEKPFFFNAPISINAGTYTALVLTAAWQELPRIFKGSSGATVGIELSVDFADATSIEILAEILNDEKKSDGSFSSINSGLDGSSQKVMKPEIATFLAADWDQSPFLDSGDRALIKLPPFMLPDGHRFKLYAKKTGGVGAADLLASAIGGVSI